MTTPNLAKIERVDLREAWPNEARDFTPWLAENIAELGEALGMDLELQQTEASVGDYSLDVLATDLNQNRPVIIENQLETTDHDHLGKLLTYAAGHDANVIVWLTREFRDEHRAALDWLNQRTGEDTEFFGVIIELWKIGDSLPAPHFRLAAAPNDWRKRTISRRDRILSEVDESRREFFGSLFDALTECGVKVPRKIPTGYAQFTIERARLAYAAKFLSGQKKVRIALHIYSRDAEWNRQIMEGLKESKDEIESTLGESLSWQQGTKDCMIALERAGDIDAGKDDRLEIRNWMVVRLLSFREIFDPMLSQLLRELSIEQEQATIE